jgi:hypothetical protein
MTRDLEAALQARKYPFRIEYGPSKIGRKVNGTSILVERDRKTSDSIEPPPGNRPNPRMNAVRGLAVRARFFVRSSKKGAHIGDHERECEALVDAFIVSLREWIVEARAGTFPKVVEARFLSAEECDDVEEWPGVAFVLRFTVSRAVLRLDYTGAARGEAVIAEQHGTEVRVQRTSVANPDDPPEVIDLE